MPSLGLMWKPVSIHEVSWVTYKGQKYIPLKCEVAFGETNTMPEFGHVQYIWLRQEICNGEHMKHVYFGLRMYETVRFDENILGYVVDEPAVAQGLELVHIDNIFGSSPLHLYKGKEESFIVAHDLLDLVRLKHKNG